MRWLKRILLGVLSLIILVALMGAGWVMKVNLEHSRDEGAFIEGLAYEKSAACKGCQKHPTFAAVDDDFLIAEGDRACAWLGEQPYPLWRRGDQYSTGELTDRYVAEVPASDEEWSGGLLEPQDRVAVVYSAWDYLCGEAQELREPHNPFTRPPSD